MDIAEGTRPTSVEKELRNAAMVDALGIPAPRCYGSVAVDGRVGIVYERAAGESLLSVLLRTGDAEGCARVMAAGTSLTTGVIVAE